MYYYDERGQNWHVIGTPVDDVPHVGQITANEMDRRMYPRSTFWGGMEGGTSVVLLLLLAPGFLGLLAFVISVLTIPFR